MRRQVGVLMAALALATSCGVQRDDEPRTLAGEAVPFGLLEPDTALPNAADEPTEATVRVYLVDNNGLLVDVRRSVPRAGGIRVALRALLEGVTAAEADAGLRSAITSGTALLGLSGPQEGVVTVDVSAELSGVSPEGQRLALAQLVFTVTVAPDVSGVLFQFDGQPRQVPNAQGETITGPVTRQDFAELDPNQAASP